MTGHYGTGAGEYSSHVAGGAGDATDLVRTVALTSARLWEEVLERLARVEESHAELRQAVAQLQASLPAGAGSGPALGTGQPGAPTNAWEPVTEQLSAAVPPPATAPDLSPGLG
jgi:hypothetical protein